MNKSVAEKMVTFSYKCTSWRFISKMKVTCMQISCFILPHFTVNVFFFQFLSLGISIYIPILTGVPDERINRSRNGHVLLKMYISSLISNFKFTCLPVAFVIFWLFGIPIHISILPAVQHGRISSWKYFLAVNVLFDSFNWKVNCMPLTCFICSLFNVNTFFFSS